MDDQFHMIFSASDCPSHQQLLDYLFNRLTDMEKHRVEAHLIDCAMCSDELEGLAAMKNPEELPDIVAEIESGIKLHRSRRIPVYIRYVMATAALILLMVGAYFIFPFVVKKEHPPLVSEETTLPAAESSEKKLREAPPPEVMNLPVEVPVRTKPVARMSSQSMHDESNHLIPTIPVMDTVPKRNLMNPEVESLAPVNAAVAGVALPVISDSIPHAGEVSLNQSQVMVMEYKVPLVRSEKPVTSEKVIPVMEYKMPRSNIIEPGQALMDSAMVAFLRQDYRKAATFFKDILADNPDNESAIYHLAYCFAELKERKKAVKELDKILSDSTCTYFQKARDLHDNLMRK